MERVERVEDATNIIGLFENDIDFYLHEFIDIQGIDDMKKESQSVWNGALTYIYRHVFKGNKQILKQRNNIYTNNTIMSTNCNAYNYNAVSKVLDYYIYLCQIYSKEISIVGFSNLTGIHNDVIHEWGNGNRLSKESHDIYKRLSSMREESLSNKLADGKQNPVGVIAMLNRHYGWASPYTADANRSKKTLSAQELPQLAPNNTQIEDKNGSL